MPLRYPPSGDSYLVDLVNRLNAALGVREPEILGVRQDGAGGWHLRFRAASETPWVRVHIQTAEDGGASYDPDDFDDRETIDCRESRVQDVEIPDGEYHVWLVPIQEDGMGEQIIYDGEEGRPDAMAFVELTAGGEDGGFGNLDGGEPHTNYGATVDLDAGGV